MQPGIRSGLRLLSLFRLCLPGDPKPHVQQRQDHEPEETQQEKECEVKLEHVVQDEHECVDHSYRQ
jgi:hypothetical protein